MAASAFHESPLMGCDSWSGRILQGVLIRESVLTDEDYRRSLPEYEALVSLSRNGDEMQ